jgi:hypothetical protein
MPYKEAYEYCTKSPVAAAIVRLVIGAELLQRASVIALIAEASFLSTDVSALILLLFAELYPENITDELLKVLAVLFPRAV